MKTNIITFGSFDVLHIGHLNIFRRARLLAENPFLIVGVSSDELHEEKRKGLKPLMSYEERAEIIRQIRYVDKVFKEESLEKKLEYVKEHEANVLVMGSDWEGKFDYLKPYCEVIYLPRTEHICSSDLKRLMKNRNW